jgi:predicted 3-demethylubiquinone-9 3-methyltransferase (glyoxalase superfamily)
MGQKITPFLWFDGQAEDAAKFYVSVFKDAELLDVSRYGEGAPFPAGTALVASFRLGELTFSALNGGPHYSFSEAISFSIDCADQEEVDYYWEKLSEGGSEGPCGWLKDQYGLSWQVVPRILPELLQGDDPAKAGAAMQAMMQMSKLDVARLQAAYDAA